MFNERFKNSFELTFIYSCLSENISDAIIIIIIIMIMITSHSFFYLFLENKENCGACLKLVENQPGLYQCVHLYAPIALQDE